MRDELKSLKPWKYEMGIINLDESRGKGTHWCAYSKKNNDVTYFDSYGLRPPPEIRRYFNGSRLVYSNEQIQGYDSVNCGHLCLQFLIKEGGNLL